MTRITNTPFDALDIGMTAALSRIARTEDFIVCAHATGNMNPAHLPHPGFAEGDAVAPSLWLGGLISAVLGNRLPGPGTLYKSHTLRFLARVHAGEQMTAHVKLTEKGPERHARFETWITREDGRIVAEGEVDVIAPDQPMSFEQEELPGLMLERHRHFDALLAEAEALPPIPTAVIVPEGKNSLGGALLGMDHTLIEPILVGDPDRIAAAAQELGRALDGIEIVPAATPGTAARVAVAMVRDGHARALMKGDLHTDQMLAAVLDREKGLRTGRRLSHVFVMDVPGLAHLLLISDAAINIAPDLQTKVEITQNAIDLAIALGLKEPKVGILSAVETVTPSIPSTLDAAILSKMAERGQITGGIVDGPLAMDNAIDIEAARTKGIISLVAGRAEVLIVPNMEAGNMLAKQLSFMAHAEAGGVVMGASCPIILTSRADDDKARLASCAVAALYDAHGTKG
jgi:phosphate butyryltransferase